MERIILHVTDGILYKRWYLYNGYNITDGLEYRTDIIADNGWYFIKCTAFHFI